VRLRALARREPTRLLTLDHAAEYLDSSPRTVQRLLDDGELRKVHVKGALRVRADDLAAYIDRQTEPGR